MKNVDEEWKMWKRERCGKRMENVDEKLRMWKNEKCGGKNKNWRKEIKNVEEKLKTK